MNREIKFRAWDSKNKEMIAPAGVGTDGEPLNAYDELMDNCTLMQFTGLKDKNGKEIYEGDVVNLDGGITIPFQVVWVSAGFSLQPQSGWIEDGANVEMNFNTVCEIIGNVWENPELLQSLSKRE